MRRITHYTHQTRDMIRTKKQFFSPLRHFTAFWQTLRTVFGKYWGMPLKIALVCIGLFVLLIAVRSIESRASNASSVVATPPSHVQVLPAGVSMQQQEGVRALGEVSSNTQGDLRAQRAGIITAVRYQVAQHVRAGSIIAVIENAQQRAGVAQAQAGVAQAQAAYRKVVGGTRSEQLAILHTATQRAQQTLREVHTTARNSLLTTYATTNTVFTGGIDTLFIDPTGPNPRLSFMTAQSGAGTLAEHQRFLLESTIERHAQLAQKVYSMSKKEIAKSLDTAEQDVRAMKTSVDSLAKAVDAGIFSTAVSAVQIAQYKVQVIAARNALIASLQRISQTRNALTNARSALVVSQQQESLGVTGAQKEDVSIAQARLDAARASRAQAQAQLEKTYIRTPVTGSITRFDGKVGDFVTMYQNLGLVANTERLSVKVYTSPQAAASLRVGQNVILQKKYRGIVSHIAESIDPLTQQIEVAINVATLPKDVRIPNGSKISVLFIANPKEISQTTTLRIPVTALKLVGNKPFIFTVDDTQRLVARPVTIGAVTQNDVTILSGITTSTPLVIDVRGLSTGDSVIVDTLPVTQ